jgi:hypothetical protein
MDSSLSTKLNDAPKSPRTLTWEWWSALYLRLALGASFLSGIADRFGLYSGRNVGYGNFAGFVRYTAKVNSFMPAFTILFLAWAATVAEFSLGLALVAWHLAALGSSWFLHTADPVRHCHGYFVRHKVSAGLFSVLCFGRSPFARSL